LIEGIRNEALVCELVDSSGLCRPRGGGIYNFAEMKGAIKMKMLGNVFIFVLSGLGVGICTYIANLMYGHSGAAVMGAIGLVWLVIYLKIIYEKPRGDKAD
jgi:hypothetical protein